MAQTIIASSLFMVDTAKQRDDEMKSTVRWYDDNEIILAACCVDRFRLI